MSLYCTNCHQTHNFDEHPDTGECAYCEGLLVESPEEEKALRQGIGHAIVGAVSDGLAAVGIARKKAGKGTQ